MKRLGIVLFLFVCALIGTLHGDGFKFTRLQYPGIYDDTNVKNWYTDTPEMDDHIVDLLRRITIIDASKNKTKLTKEVFENPFIYTVEPEQMKLSDADIKLFREWLDRGGFWFADDFHGTEELSPVLEILARLYPEETRTELVNTNLEKLDLSHPLFHTFFGIPKLVQVVNDGLAMCTYCAKWENGESGEVPVIYGHYDSAGQLNIVWAYNNDLGDGLEWASDPAYPHEMATFATKMLTNTIIYSLTH